jgi:chromosome segregation ATPase
MAKPEPSALVDAASAFDAELATYARLGELFLRSPLNTLKHVERANATLGELAQSEQRLQEAGQKLVVALTGARQRQEQLSKHIVDHAPALQARNGRLQQLMTALGQLAGDVSKLNQDVLQKNGDHDAPSLADTDAVSAAVLALSTRAEELAASAREADFAELAEQAHALHQRLQAIAKKLQKAPRPS